MTLNDDDRAIAEHRAGYTAALTGLFAGWTLATAGAPGWLFGGLVAICAGWMVWNEDRDARRYDGVPDRLHNVTASGKVRGTPPTDGDPR